MQKWNYKFGHHTSNSLEGLVLGGLAGGECLSSLNVGGVDREIAANCFNLVLVGISAYLTTPLDVIKTRLQVQGSTARYNPYY